MPRPFPRLPLAYPRAGTRVLVRRVVSALLVIVAAALSAIVVKAHSQTLSPSNARAHSASEAMHLRYLSTPNTIGPPNSSTIVFPVPPDLLSMLTGREPGPGR